MAKKKTKKAVKKSSATKGTKSTKKKAAKKTSKKKAASRKLRVATVKKLAFECDTMAEAQERLIKSAPSIAEAITSDVKIAAAWTRGRFLRNLAGHAGAIFSEVEAARELGLDPEELARRIKADAEVKDTWYQARIKTTVDVKRALVENAKAGKARAIETFEKMLVQEAGIGVVDFHRVTFEQMEDIAGVTRQTIYDWRTKYGLPQNSDNTIDLTAFVKWYETFVVKKLDGGKIKGSEPENPLQNVKAEKLRTELAAAKGQLLDRGEVVTGLLARYQNMINAQAKLIDQIALACAHQPAEKIRQALEKGFDEIKAAMCKVPEELRLPEAAGKLYVRLLKGLATEPAEGSEKR